MQSKTQTATDGGEALHEASGREIFDLFDVLQPGDKVLWGDRKIPCTVARVVDAEDRIGQALTAGVCRFGVEKPDDTDLRDGDVFLTPGYWGMTGKRFVLIQGPRGGFYAIVKTRRRGTPYPALFRAVRTYHQTRAGHRGQGAFVFDSWFGETLRVVDHGEAPEVLDEGGDLPAYADIKDHRVMTYVKPDDSPTIDGVHVEVGTVAEVFDEGLFDAQDRAQAEGKALLGEVPQEDSPWDDVPSPDSVRRQTLLSDGTTFGTVTVTNIFESEFGLKAELDTPAPWDCPEGATPVNDVLKDTPWEENHRQWDPDREAWTVDADELVGISYELAYAGYAVADEAEREGDA